MGEQGQMGEQNEMGEQSEIGEIGETGVEATGAARELIRALRGQHGELLFHQSGGCCDGSSPMCFARGEFKLGAHDVLLGVVEGCEFWIGGAQHERWKHTRLTLDVVKGRGASFSLEIPEGVRFIIRSSLCAV